MFPLQRGTSRLAVQLPAVGGDPWLGPASYLGQEESSLWYSWGRRPLSKRGYVIGARTAQRFAPRLQVVTPAPASYQPFWNRERRFQPAFAPFATKAPRFPAKPSEKELFPGPGTYDVGKQLHKKVTWPMKFGSPDWSLVPMPAKRMLKMEVQKLTIDRAFRKNQDRVAYLSLYYS
ncbi:ciliary microtubule-associated protein 3 isoform X1 [Pogoniulus pusillus]|uniref:ciliary microtubule-associated protein 3 isoform X1 n=1 Tax=Pogoniulus pusillus TaxID=488313 RepID=UPI0030B93AC6